MARASQGMDAAAQDTACRMLITSTGAGVAARDRAPSRRDGGQAQFIEQPVADASSQQLGPALAWALEHLAENLAIDRLATIAAMSRRTFYREFHAVTGTTPHRWLIAQRIILARRLLETTRQSVTEIAQQSGFDDISVFRRHFTSQAGVSPTTYRRRFGQLDDEPGIGHRPGKI